MIVHVGYDIHGKVQKVQLYCDYFGFAEIFRFAGIHHSLALITHIHASIEQHSLHKRTALR